jgi:PLAT/LH2 domain
MSQRLLLCVIECEFTVKVYTGDEFGAGTDANVYLTLYGELGESGERQLKDSDNKNPFEKSQVIKAQNVFLPLCLAITCAS